MKKIFLLFFISIGLCTNLKAQDRIIGATLDSALNRKYGAFICSNIVIQDLGTGYIDTIIHFTSGANMLTLFAMDHFNNRYFFIGSDVTHCSNADSCFNTLYTVDVSNRTYTFYNFDYADPNDITLMAFDPIRNSIIYEQNSYYGSTSEFYEFNLDSSTIKTLTSIRPNVTAYEPGTYTAYDFKNHRILYPYANSQNVNYMALQDIFSGQVIDSLQLGYVKVPCFDSIAKVISSPVYDYINETFVATMQQNTSCNSHQQVIYNVDMVNGKTSMTGSHNFNDVLNEQMFCYNIPNHKIFMPSYVNGLSGSPITDTMFAIDYLTNATISANTFSQKINFNDYAGTTPDNSIIFINSDNSLIANYGKAYQWYLDNQILAGETKQTTNPTLSGNYYAMVTDLNNGVTKSNVISYNALGIKPVTDNSSITVLTNPFNDMLSVKYSGPENNCELDIYNILGINVGSMQVSGNGPFNFNTSLLSQGAYFLVSKDANGNTEVKRVVKL